MERSLYARLCKEDPFSGLISNSSWMVGSLLEAQYSCPSVSRGNCFSTRIHQSPTSTGIFAWILHTLIDLLYITTRWCLLPNATKRYVNSSNVLFRENNFYAFSIFFTEYSTSTVIWVCRFCSHGYTPNGTSISEPNASCAFRLFSHLPHDSFFRKSMRLRYCLDRLRSRRH